MTMPPFRLIAGLSGLLACFGLSSCENTKEKSGYDDVVDYTSPNTRMSKEEFPFDDAGNYREDWAARGAGVRGVRDKPTVRDTPYIQEPEKPRTPVVAVRSSYASPYVQEPDAPRTPTVAARSSYTPSTPRKSSSGSSSSRNTASRSKPKPKPKPKPTFVKVGSGDTLYGLSKKHG